MRHFEVAYMQTTRRGTIMGTIDPRIVCIHGATELGSAFKVYVLIKHSFGYSFLFKKVILSVIQIDYISSASVLCEESRHFIHD